MNWPSRRSGRVQGMNENTVISPALNKTRKILSAKSEINATKELSEKRNRTEDGFIYSTLYKCVFSEFTLPF